MSKQHTSSSLLPVQGYELISQVTYRKFLYTRDQSAKSHKEAG